MHLTRAKLFLLGLAAMAAAADFNPKNNTAGYDTSRVGPSNANCQRQTYELDITSNNIQFQNVDSNANQVRVALRATSSGRWLTETCRHT